MNIEFIFTPADNRRNWQSIHTRHAHVIYWLRFNCVSILCVHVFAWPSSLCVSFWNNLNWLRACINRNDFKSGRHTIQHSQLQSIPQHNIVDDHSIKCVFRLCFGAQCKHIACSTVLITLHIHTRASIRWWILSHTHTQKMPLCWRSDSFMAAVDKLFNGFTFVDVCVCPRCVRIVNLKLI